MEKSLKFYFVTLLLCISSPLYTQSDSSWNLNFEEWNIEDTRPDLWFDTIVENRVGLFPPKWHYRPDFIPEGTGLGQTTDATEGHYAVALSGYYSYEFMRIISGEDSKNSGWAIDYRPTKLIGDYKVILLGTGCDSLRAYVDVVLTVFNNVSLKRDTVGIGGAIFNETSIDYEKFTVDIDYLNEWQIPDTVVITLAQRRFGFDVPPECLECSHVYFDNLLLSKAPNTSKIDISDIQIIPNPASQNICIKLGNTNNYYNIRIRNSEGQLVKEVFNQNINVNFDITNFEKGIYFIEIYNLSVKTIKRILIN